MYNLLSGHSVIEASSFVAAPSAGLYCAQMGMGVIRVDQIGGGPDQHRWPVTAGNHSLYWENLNRAKRSVALDLGSGAGRELLQALIRACGQLITNYPANGFLGHELLASGRPDLVTVRVMGWPDGSTPCRRASGPARASTMPSSMPCATSSVASPTRRSCPTPTAGTSPTR